MEHSISALLILSLHILSSLSGDEELLSPTDDPVVKCKWNDDDEDGRGDDMTYGAGAKSSSGRADLVIDSTKGTRKVHIEPEEEDDDDDDDNDDRGRSGNNHHHESKNGGRKRPTPIVPDGPRIIKLPKDTRSAPPVLDDTSLRDLETAKKALQVTTKVFKFEDFSPPPQSRGEGQLRRQGRQLQF